MKTRNNLDKKCNAKKTRKNKILKGGALTGEEIEYYSDFMAIKSDATAIFHQNVEIRTMCIEICKLLTYKICMTPNDIFNYIKNVVVPDMFVSITDQGNVFDMEKITNFIKNEFNNNEEQYELSLNAFIKIHTDGYVSSIDDMKNYVLIFYRFYLKGGSACVFMVQLYNFYISSHEELKKQNRKISEDEMIELLGKYSDYDFNFLINRNIAENHYNQLTLIASVNFCNFLIEIIDEFSSQLFNNDRIIRKFKSQLSTNKIPLNTADDLPNQILKVKGNFNNYASQFGYNNENRLLKSIRNNPANNKLGYININYLKIDNNAYKGEGYKNANFILIRLMTYLINSIKSPNEHEFPPISAELIDISIPLYDSYERNVKWVEESNTIKLIDGVYCYNLNVIIKDLTRMIYEDEILGNLKKIEKRKKRLVFFNNLICMLPRILFKENELYKETGLETTYDNCKKIINYVFTCDDFNRRPKLLNYLTNITEGIYLNFPDIINISNLDVYVLLKQYFYHQLIISLQSQMLKTEYYSIENVKLYALKQNTVDNCKYIYDNMNDNYFNFIYAIDTNVNICENINSYLINDVYKYIDVLKTRGLPGNRICIYFILFNAILFSFIDNPILLYDGLMNFIEYLKKISKSLKIGDDSNPYQPIINVRDDMIRLMNSHDKFISTKIKGNEIRKKIIYETLNIINNDRNAIKLYIHGDYAYQMQYALMYFYYKNGILDDMDSALNSFLSNNYSIFDVFNFKIIFPSTMENVNINEIYNRYKDMCYTLLNDEYLYLSNYPCKINIDLVNNNDFYNIICKINIYYPVNKNGNDNVPDNINNYMMDILKQTNSPQGYRILTYTLFNISVEIGTDYSDKKYYMNLNDIINDNGYLNEHNINYIYGQNVNFNYKKYFLDYYQEYLKQDIFTNVFIEPINNIIDNYNKIVDDVELDMIIKYKYGQRLLNLGMIKDYR